LIVVEDETDVSKLRFAVTSINTYK